VHLPPYRRTVVPPTFHIMKRVLIALGALLVLVLVKTAIDVALHQREHDSLDRRPATA
jgi:hypothetical protein